MNLRMEPAGGSWPSPARHGLLSRRVAVIVQDPAIRHRVLGTLSGHYDLMVLRRLYQLLPTATPESDLILLDAATLLGLEPKEKALWERGRQPSLALVDPHHLEGPGAGLLERVQDFLVTPFCPAELLLRVNRMLRRSLPAPPAEQVVCGAFRIDLRTGEACKGNRPLPLTRKELALLYALARREGGVVTRDELLNEVWGTDYEGNSNALDVHIRSLRRKIEPVPHQPRHILTVRGVGYRLNGSADPLAL